MEKLTKAELITLGKKRGITLNPRMLKADMIEALQVTEKKATASKHKADGEW